MEPLSNALSDIFRNILEGMSYEEAGRPHNWDRRMVKSSVIRLAAALQEVVGVVGVDEGTAPTLELLRRERAAYFEALAHYVPEKAVTRRGTLVPLPAHLEVLLAGIDPQRPNGARDRALVLTLFATAAKPSELARLTVADYLNKDGSCRCDSRMPAAIAYNGIARPLFFRNERTRRALDAYLEQRLAGRHGLGIPGRYRGLAPASALFLRHDGLPLAADPGEAGARLQQVFYLRFKAAKVEGLTVLGVRRAVACKLARGGYQDTEIARVLGLETTDSVRRLLPQRPPIADAMRELF